MARPIAWAQQFARQAPLQVEIGFGNGEFLVRTAQEHPEWNFVGLEPEWASVQRGLRRIARAQVANVRLVLVDARTALERLFGAQSIHRVCALFPCPWPKERHAKHRLLSHELLILLNNRLESTGTVQMVTDQKAYLDWVLTQLPDTGFHAQWESVPPRFSTKYERKWSETGQQEFYDLRLCKVTHMASPQREDVTVQTHRIAHFEPTALQLGHAHGAIAVACKEFLYDPQRRKGLVWVFVTEDGLTQDFWIEIAGSDRGWVIRPARGCSIVPTLGVQSALDLVRDMAQQTTRVAVD
jgi:tRNA (guanine-N7-)-methyltransferase